MRNRGFTLVELLAVIVVLGIIMSIAIPRIINVIDSSKSNIYISNIGLVEKGFELYLSNHEEILPKYVGETVEIGVQTLIDNQHLNSITSPFNKNEKCTGYILINKTEDGYIKTPHINCVKNINNNEEDKLILYYPFFDFQEPTQNIFTELNLSTIEMGGITYNSVGVEDGWIKYSISGTGSSSTYPYTFRINPMIINSEFFLSTSFKYKTNVISKYNIFGDPRMVNIFYKPGFNRNEINRGEYVEASLEMISPLSLTDGTPIVGEKNEAIYFLSRPNVGTVFNPETDYLSFKDIQVEKKSYSTPYTEGTRTGIVKDYSGNNNNSILTITNTPRWIHDNERKSGVYEFNGLNSILASKISTTFNYQKFNEYTISLWAYKKSNNTFQVLIGGEVGNNASMAIITSTNNAINFHCYDTTDKTLLVSKSNVFPLNKWTHIVATVKYTTIISDVASGEIILYANGNEIGRNTFSNITLFDRNTVIGSPSNNTYNRAFEGRLSDIRIYNRLLSKDEIKLLYEATK